MKNDLMFFEKREYEIREMDSVGRQIYGKLLYVTKNFEDALENLAKIQNKDKNRKVGLLVTGGYKNEKKFED